MSELRVAFDASPLVRPHPPGIVRVVRESLGALEERGRLEVVRLTPRDGVDLRRWRQREVPAELRGLGCAGVHSFLSAFPLRGPGKRVHTVHELPWKHRVKENGGLRHRLWASLGAAKADATVTGTEVVARELGKRLAREGGRLHVVPWGVGEAFCEEPPPGEVDEVVLGHYRLPEAPLVLAPGAVRAKKNLAALLAGMGRLVQREGPKPHLVVTGADTPDLRRDLGTAQKLGLARHTSTPGRIEEEHLPALLRLASVVAVLSKSEGFGLPVLEALASGTPVVVPRGSAQAEVAGPDAFLCDPDDPESVADALGEAIARREELRYLLPERAREFPWSRTAEGIEAVWESLR